MSKHSNGKTPRSLCVAAMLISTCVPDICVHGSCADILPAELLNFGALWRSGACCGFVAFALATAYTLSVLTFVVGAAATDAPRKTEDVPFELEEDFEEVPLFVAMLTMVNYAILTAFGYLRDFMRARNWEPSMLKVEKANQLVCSLAQHSCLQ